MLKRFLYLALSAMLCGLSFYVNAARVSLIEQLNNFSEKFSIAIIYDRSLLEGVEVEASSAPNNDINRIDFNKQLTTWLKSHQLNWKQTSSGILIYNVNNIPKKSIENSVNQLEEVTVIGQLPTGSLTERYNDKYQQSVDYAQLIKSNNAGETDFILGAMLTQLPAENLAEALQAVPGLSITRDRGEALNINAMGLGAEYQLTLFNGRRLANTENVRNSNQYGKAHRFDIFSAGLFSNVAVSKTADPRLPSGAIGATVNLFSDAPLDYQKNNLDVRLTVAALEGERDLQPSFGITANTKFADDTVGLIVKMNYESRLQRQFQFESWHWGENGGALNVYQWPDIDDDILVPTDGLALTIENEDRIRATIYSALAWQPSELLTINTLWFRSETDFAFDEYRLSINPLSQSAKAKAIHNKNSLDQFIFSNVTGKSSREESTLYYANKTFQTDMKWQPHQRLIITPFYSHSVANSLTKEPISRVHVGLSPMDALVELQNYSVDKFTFDRNLKLVSSYSNINQMSKRNINVLNKVDEWGIDSQWDSTGDSLLGKRLKTLNFGFLHSAQAYKYTRRDVSLSVSALAALPKLDGRWLESIPDLFSADFMNSDTQDWLIPKSDLFQLYDISLPFGGVTDNDLLNSYKVTYVSKEGYLQSQWQLGHWSFDTGLRYSDMKSQIAGAQLNAATEAVFPLNDSLSFVTWLPSLNILWQPSLYWQWRAGYSRSYNRPNYSDLNPKVHVNSGGLPYAELGNPALQPVVANTTTFSVTWLQTSLNAQLLGFNHNIDNLIVEQKESFNYQNIEYNSLQRTNDGAGNINGLQASIHWLLPLRSAWFSESSVGANITRIINANFTTPDESNVRIDGVSDFTANVRFVVSDDSWQAGLNVNHRSEFLTDRDVTNNADSYIKAYTSTDLSFSWLYSDSLRLRVDVFNVTNEPIFSTAKTDAAASLMKAEDFGRRFVVGLSLTL
ncbi:TonB-dependent receptor [Colwellia sp. 1_MG-2023]|uniref:TonB-dependent receptor n=1 Tax=unclassified Colwellia TaxID=196834 RepID=UPI001C089B54|nr:MULTISPECIES: TonB-dependent receptor [unclassified Colwellia]MBU2926376.1 TonB-dependent receptor [Colwellia sp. C2M11]MDO6651814.1 TonB-dependent receptor [Colwellia sp. 3_MG-2023]MDO6665275.1 TonB-dependent receptor [Colwellia sp. 2_MG-2023]MDO6689648.1 TonB-dependent receptor [Colwellia sp. 1_MG-2023]